MIVSRTLANTNAVKCSCATINFQDDDDDFQSGKISQANVQFIFAGVKFDLQFLTSGDGTLKYSVVSINLSLAGSSRDRTH